MRTSTDGHISCLRPGEIHRNSISTTTTNVPVKLPR
jgi:hypothetical protein